MKLLAISILALIYGHNTYAMAPCDASQWAHANSICQGQGVPTGACTCDVTQSGDLRIICDSVGKVICEGPGCGRGPVDFNDVAQFAGQIMQSQSTSTIQGTNSTPPSQ